MNRVDLFEKALIMSQERYERNSEYFILKEIISQLKYLLAISQGKINDFSKLKTITIGRIVAHDLDNWDAEFANILYITAEEARKMDVEGKYSV